MFGSEWAAAGVASAQLNANIVAQYENRREQRRQNQWAKDYQDFSYYRSRNDSLSDQKHFEDYNSPINQIKRMKEAGLNPALMYGQGNVGQTEMPRSAKAEGSSMPASQIDSTGIAQAFEKFFTILQTQAQSDNIRAQAELAEKQSRNLDTTNDLNKFDLQQKQALSPNVLESSALALENTKADIMLKKQAYELNLDANERAQLKNSTDVLKTLEDINTMRQKRIFDLSQQENIDHKAKAEIKELELKMDQLDQQTAILNITRQYAEKDAQMKLLLQELEADIKHGGGGVGGILAKITSKLMTILSPEEIKELKKRYPTIF